ncbi:Virulence-associated protein E [Bradyrhizobium shewense]|uniref:Virulence-associated protein E n=1 Tax=Bradyrhizobium shewense TaxID=1761772 RepID=A0A1C3WDD1_9BRAD|nr:VapE domain-containing protein [Bradyrhizobium shewense]SCB37704.1 Virulence-associated protein E [Bradyrhizobium shewense]
MLTNYFPHTAEIDGRWLIFYDHSFALARVELHEDQEPGQQSGTEKAIELYPDDWEGGDRMLVRLKPETLRIFERGVIPDTGDEHLWFDREVNRQFIIEDFPALKVEAYRRTHVDAVARWEKEVARISAANPDVTNDDLPPQPVFEPARAEWEAWQAVLADKDALYARLDRELTPEARKQGRPALNSEQCAAVDTISKKVQITAEAYWSQVPVENKEPKSQDEVRRQKLYGPPAGSLIGQTPLAIANLAARPIDEFNEGWAGHERWPDAPQLPPQVEATYPAIFHQLNSAIRRIVTMAQKPRTFRADRCAHIIAIVGVVHEETVKALIDLIRENKCALPEDTLARSYKSFEEKVVWEVQGKNRGSYITTSTGKPDPASFDNVRIFLNLRGVDLRFDEFTNSIEGNQGRYDDWRRLDENQRKALWLDTHASAHGFYCSWDFFRASVERIAREYSYDALRNAIDSLKWDGVQRLDNWLSKAVGCPDDAYHRAVGANLIGGLVKRARKPGAKHDETVIFISEEGKAKSTMCKALALRPEWFIDSVELGGRPQDVIPQLKGKQIIELAELAGMSKTETTKLKAFMSRENDNATLKWKEEASDHLRRHIFIATTNEDTPLLSQTGNRRWLPVHIADKIDIEWVRENIEQLYAEAAEWHATGEDFRIPEALWAVAGKHQDAARERTGAEDVLAFTFGNADCYVTAADVQTFASERGLPLRDVRAALKGLGFVSVAHREGDDVRKVWRRGPPEAAVRFKAESFVNRPCELVVDRLAQMTKAVTDVGMVAVTTIPLCPVGLPPIPPRG